MTRLEPAFVQAAVSHVRRRDTPNLGAEDHVNQPVYVQLSYPRSMLTTKWHFRCSGTVRDRSNPLREFARVQQDHAPLAVPGAITLAEFFLAAYIKLRSPL